MRVYVPVLSDRYEVYSHGNGWAYEVCDVHTGCSFWVQDDDAEALRVATENFEDVSCFDEYMSVAGSCE